MQDRDEDLQTKIVSDVRRVTMHYIVSVAIVSGSTVDTNELSSHVGTKILGYIHIQVRHTSVGIFERSIRSTDSWVRQKYLSKYLGETEFLRNVWKEVRQLFLRMFRLPRAA